MNLKAELRGMATAGALALGAALLLVSEPRGLPGVELLQSLRFHLAALGVPLVALLVMTGARWRGLLITLVVVASVGQGLLPVLDANQRRAAVDGDTLGSIKVLSFNVLASQNGRDAADFIISQAPDIAVIMETPGVEPYLAEIARVLPYRLGCEQSQTCDLTIFSRTPLTSAKMSLMPPFHRERLAVVSTVIDGVPLSVVGIHLSKPYFDGAASHETLVAGRTVNKVEGRVIVAGDFNAAAWSDQLIAFSEGTNLVPPPTHPGTWPVEAGDLGVPIDNMFTRGDVLIDSIYAPADSYGSNHRALVARVSLRAAAALQP